MNNFTIEIKEINQNKLYEAILYPNQNNVVLFWGFPEIQPGWGTIIEKMIEIKSSGGGLIIFGASNFEGRINFNPYLFMNNIPFEDIVPVFQDHFIDNPTFTTTDESDDRYWFEQRLKEIEAEKYAYYELFTTDVSSKGLFTNEIKKHSILVIKIYPDIQKINLDYSFKKSNSEKLQKFKHIDIENELLFETICAFANKKGGNILFGVGVNGMVHGIDKDLLDLDIIEKINGQLDKKFNFSDELVYVSKKKVGSKSICLINVRNSVNKVYLNKKFYVRNGIVNKMIEKEEDNDKSVIIINDNHGNIHTGSENNKYKIEEKNEMKIGKNNGQINISKDSSTLTAIQNFGDNSESMTEFEGLVKHLLEELTEVPEEQAKVIKQSVAEFEEEINSEEPKVGKIMTAVANINKIIPMISAFPQVVEGLEKMTNYISSMF